MSERLGRGSVGAGLFAGAVALVAGAHQGVASAAISWGVSTPWYMRTSSMFPDTKSTKAELCLPRPMTVRPVAAHAMG